MNRPAALARARRGPRALRWGIGAVLLALMPKCLLCVAAFLGLGAALGLTSRELCGPAPTVPPWMFPPLVLSAATVFAWWLRRRRAI